MSEVDFWSQEAIAKGINNTTPAASEIADIPRTRQQQAMYIQEMFEALKNTQGIIEKASNVKVGIVKSTSGRVFQDIAWVLYREARKFQQGKPDVNPWCTSFMYKQYPTLRARWNEMVAFFRTSKAAVANLIVAHSEKRFAGNPTEEKRRKTQNDKSNKTKATKMKDNEEKAATLDKVVKGAKGKVAAAKSAPEKGTTIAGAPEKQDGGFVDEEELEAKASEDPDDEDEAGETDDEAEESNDNDEESEDNDDESDDEAKHPLEEAAQDEGSHGDNENEQDSDNLNFQSGQAMGDPAALAVPFAGSLQPHAPAYQPLPGSIGRRQQVRAIALNEGHLSSIMPSDDHQSYHPFYPAGLVGPNVHPQYIEYLNGNDQSSLSLPGQPMNYLEQILNHHTGPSPSQLPSGNGFMGQAQEGGGSNTAVGTSHIDPMPLNTRTSGAGGGSQSNTDPQDTRNHSHPPVRRNRDSFEDGSETHAEAPSKRRPRL
ncbi:hypothetical protein N0V85_007964 [Neurospora sp. IMI 360204]|nr:hypothetical protein N0V85_007964 [Neurospora sp. IMI 360204]